MTYSLLVTGSDGQLGCEIRSLVSGNHAPASWQWHFHNKQTLDITDADAVARYCRTNAINVIINCAAYTAVDKAEAEPEQANRINHLAVQNLAFIAKQYHCRLIHVSTDYVFDGTSTKPYTENALPNPVNAYGKTKLAGEQCMQTINPANSVIIRTSWLYSAFGSNFVKNVLQSGKKQPQLNIVDGQTGTPTYARDLAVAILHIIPRLHNHDVQIFHYANEGICSRHDFARAIIEITRINCQIQAAKTADHPALAKRPHYSALATQHFKTTFGITIPGWKNSLAQCLLVISSDITGA